MYHVPNVLFMQDIKSRHSYYSSKQQKVLLLVLSPSFHNLSRNHMKLRSHATSTSKTCIFQTWPLICWNFISLSSLEVPALFAEVLPGKLILVLCFSVPSITFPLPAWNLCSLPYIPPTPNVLESTNKLELTIIIASNRTMSFILNKLQLTSFLHTQNESQNYHFESRLFLLNKRKWGFMQVHYNELFHAYAITIKTSLGLR